MELDEAWPVDDGGLDETAPLDDAEGRPDPPSVDLRHVRDHAYEKGDKRGCCAAVDGARCGAAKTAMLHVGAPQSVNLHGSGANRFVYQAIKKAWQARLAELLDWSDLPRGLGFVLVEGQCCFPDRRKRDQGNYRAALEKALGDALVEGGWLPDDDWERYEFGRLRYAYEAGESWTALTVYPAWSVADYGRGA